MSRKHQRPNDIRGKGKAPTFAMVLFKLMDSAAWQDISHTAQAAYLQLRRIYNGQNNGSLAMGARSLADRLHVGKSTAARALAELEAHGIIRASTPGGFNVNGRRASEWTLTDAYDNKAGKPATHDYQQWAPSEKQNIVPPVGHQVPPAGRNGKIIPQPKPTSPTSGTVDAVSVPDKSHQRDTYRYLPDTVAGGLGTVEPNHIRAPSASARVWSGGQPSQVLSPQSGDADAFRPLGAVKTIVDIARLIEAHGVDHE